MKRDQIQSGPEVRSYSAEVEVRQAADPAATLPTLRGHAAVFNQWARVLWWDEMIAPGAFSEAIAEDDVRAVWNHRVDLVLGRNTSGTLRLTEDETGLLSEIDPPDTQAGRDAVVSIERRDVTQMSFGFRVKEDRWELNDDDDKPDRRTILKIRPLFEVSPVTFPAFEATDIALAEGEIEPALRALTRHRLGRELRDGDLEAIAGLSERLDALARDHYGTASRRRIPPGRVAGVPTALLRRRLDHALRRC